MGIVWKLIMFASFGVVSFVFAEPSMTEQREAKKSLALFEEGVRMSDVTKVQAAFDLGFKVSSETLVEDYSPLVAAIYGKGADLARAEVIRLLMTQDFSDQQAANAVKDALFGKSTEVLEALLSHPSFAGDRINSGVFEHGSLFDILALNKDRILFPVFIENSHFDVNQFDQHGHSRLMRAAEAGSVELVKGLLGRADLQPNLSANRGTALHFAVQGGGADNLEALLESGRMDLSAKNISLQTFGYLALKIGRIGILRLMMKKGIPIQLLERDIFDQTAFQAAVNEHQFLGLRVVLEGFLRNPPPNWAEQLVEFKAILAEGKTEILSLVRQVEEGEKLDLLSLSHLEALLQLEGLVDLLNQSQERAELSSGRWN